MELLGNPTQLLCSGFSLVVVGCLLVPPCCSCLIISINESCRSSYCCQFSIPLALIGSLSFNICYFGCWLWVVTIATTLTSTLLGLGSLGVIITLELTNLVMNMFWTSIFLGHFPDLCSKLEQIIYGYPISILIGLVGSVLVSITCSINFIMVVNTTSTFLFLLWQVSNVTYFTTILTCWC